MRVKCKMKKSNPIYATIPITLLKNIHKDQLGTIRKMFDYAIYDRMIKDFPELISEFTTNEIELSMQYFNLKPTDLKRILEDGQQIYFNHKSAPNASINIEILNKFRQYKAEFDLMVFCSFCAFKSMIGTKSYFKTTNDYLLSRMFGYVNLEEYRNSNVTEEEQNLMIRYSKRYWLDKIKVALQDDWYLIYYSYKNKGFFVSFTMSLTALVNIAEDRKDKSKLKQLERKQDIQKALDQRKSKKNNTI